MALNLRQLGDYILLDYNVVPGTPLAAWSAGATPPTDGQLVVVDATGDNFYDLAANTETPSGIVVTTNGIAGTIGIALFVPGTQIILPFDVAPALGESIQTTAAGLKVVGRAGFFRSQVMGVAAAVGGGIVVDLAPFGVPVPAAGTETTATVRFI